jgi:hypothetical protein
MTLPSKDDRRGAEIEELVALGFDFSGGTVKRGITPAATSASDRARFMHSVWKSISASQSRLPSPGALRQTLGSPPQPGCSTRRSALVIGVATKVSESGSGWQVFRVHYCHIRLRL